MQQTMRTTADLYQPLQTALNKSIIQNPYLSRTKQRAYEKLGRTSRVSRRMKSLSPQQAHHIKQSTILPVDKVLVPTDHLWRVQGKKFSAVNIQVREGQPIPQHLMRIPVGNNNCQITTQTVYQAIPRTQLITTYITTSPPPQTTIYSPRDSVTVYSRVVPVKPVTSTVQRPASLVRVSSRPSIFQSPRYTSNQEQSTEANIDKANQINNMKKQNRFSQQEKYPLPNQYYNPERLNAYETQQSTKKRVYKYNCFSALDQPVNTQCSSCGPNEFIATKPYTSWQ